MSFNKGNLAKVIYLDDVREAVYPISKAPAYPIHPQCRCTKAPVTKSWQELGLDPKTTPEWAKKAFDGKAPRTLNYNDWLQKQEKDAPGFAKDILGPNRYKLWKSGQLKLSEMAKSNKILTVPQLRKKMGAIRPKGWKPTLPGKKPLVKPMSSIGNLSNCLLPGSRQITEAAKPDPCRDFVREGDKWFLQGKEVTDKETIERVNAMKLPPAWRQVTVSTDPFAKVQAVGLDNAGRWQYKYSSKHVEKASREKFDRLKLFSKDMSKIRAGISKGVDNMDSRALLLKLEDKTAIRAGSLTDFKAKKKAYGLTTLQHEHVFVKGSDITLKFVAKEGIPVNYKFKDSVLGPWLKHRKLETSKGERLFPDVTAGKLNKYLKELAGDKNYTIKDFRTYHGTSIAFKELRKFAGKTLSVKERKKIIKDVSEKVSKFLRNTPLMARNSYINPMVWDFIGGYK